MLDRAPSLSARVFQQLRDAVISGELAPSAPVVIEQLAATLGVSRTPIRESLLALRQLGLIEETPGGFRVTPLDADYIVEVFAVRSILEGLIVEAVAPDGQIEAVRAGSVPFAIGVQWHPEFRVMQNPVSRALFAAFGDACRARAAGRSVEQSGARSAV